MQEKNTKLAKENSNLKKTLSDKMRMQEEILKKSIKAEYNQIITYKKMLKAVDESIQALENALEGCRNVQKMVIGNRGFLIETTNLNRAEETEVQTVLDELKEKFKIEKESEDKENDPKMEEKKEKIIQIDELLLCPKPYESKRNKKKAHNIKEDLFSKWGNNK